MLTLGCRDALITGLAVLREGGRRTHALTAFPGTRHRTWHLTSYGGAEVVGPAHDGMGTEPPSLRGPEAQAGFRWAGCGPPAHRPGAGGWTPTAGARGSEAEEDEAGGPGQDPVGPRRDGHLCAALLPLKIGYSANLLIKIVFQMSLYPCRVIVTGK